MSGKLKSRYDRFIPLFGRAPDLYEDKRVRLFINDLEERANKLTERNNHASTHPDSVAFLDVSVRMMNRNFFNKDPSDDNKVHSEWALFMLQLAARLRGREVNQTTDRNMPVKLLPIVHSLANARPRSLEEIVWIILAKVARLFTDRGEIPPLGFAGNSTLTRMASEITRIVYRTPQEIWTNLDPMNLIFPIPNQNGVLGAPLNLSDTQFFNLIAARNPVNFAAHKAEVVRHVSDPDLKNQLQSASNPQQLFDMVNSYLQDGGSKEFGYNVDKYFVSLMLAEADNMPVEEESSAFFNDIPGDANMYFRKGPELLLYERDGTPEGKAVHMHSDAFKNMKVEEKCLTTGLPDSMNGTNAATGAAVVSTCADYLRDCLAGNSEGVAKCKKYMTHHEFWNNAQKEANTILPGMIVKTLTAFGFEFTQYKHEMTNQQLWKVQSVEEWLSGLNKLADDPKKNSLDKKEVTAISKNEKLRGYLAMLVKRVNENPIILNEGYNGPSNKGPKQEQLTFGLLPKFGLKLHVPANDIMSIIERTNATVTNHIHSQLRAAVLVPVMSGGANTYFDPIENAANILKYPMKQSWVILQNQYEGLKDRLNIHNKSISKADDATIRSLIEKLRESEIKLTKTMLYAEKYAKLLEVFGVNDGRSVLSFDHLAKFVDAKDSYLNKVRDRQNSLTSIIRTVAEAVAKESSNSGQQETWEIKNNNNGKARLEGFNV